MQFGPAVRGAKDPMRKLACRCLFVGGPSSAAALASIVVFSLTLTACQSSETQTNAVPVIGNPSPGGTPPIGGGTPPIFNPSPACGVELALQAREERGLVKNCKTPAPGLMKPCSGDARSHLADTVSHGTVYASGSASLASGRLALNVNVAQRVGQAAITPTPYNRAALRQTFTVNAKPLPGRDSFPADILVDASCEVDNFSFDNGNGAFLLDATFTTKDSVETRWLRFPGIYGRNSQQIRLDDFEIPINDPWLRVELALEIRDASVVRGSAKCEAQLSIASVPFSCSSACKGCLSCGNNEVDAGEECDPPSTCCDNDCHFTTAGTPCQGGLCTAKEVCNGRGSCTGVCRVGVPCGLTPPGLGGNLVCQSIRGGCTCAEVQEPERRPCGDAEYPFGCHLGDCDGAARCDARNGQCRCIPLEPIPPVTLPGPLEPLAPGGPVLDP